MFALGSIWWQPFETCDSFERVLLATLRGTRHFKVDCVARVLTNGSRGDPCPLGCGVRIPHLDKFANV